MAPERPKLQLPSSCDPPGEENPPQQAVWIIFGGTGHMGRSLVRAALSHGDKVTAVGRSQETQLEQMQNWHESCLGMLCDVRMRETVEDVIEKSVEHWGRADIIVNCTGYGVVAAAEDQSEQDLNNQFETNFYGTLHILQSSLPYFRSNGIQGRYLIFSSTAGALGVPGLAGYCATKYAVEGLVESMLYEVHCFGIKVTLVEPGHVRDDDSNDEIPIPDTLFDGLQSSTIKRYGHFAVKPNPSEPYRSPHSPSGHAKRIFQWLDTRQPTSAVRSAELVWQLAHCSYPPLRLLLGNYAVDSIRDRLKCVTEEIEDWKFLSFPAEGGVQPATSPGHARKHSETSPDAVRSGLENGDS